MFLGEAGKSRSVRQGGASRAAAESRADILERARRDRDVRQRKRQEERAATAIQVRRAAGAAGRRGSGARCMHARRGAWPRCMHAAPASGGAARRVGRPPARRSLCPPPCRRDGGSGARHGALRRSCGTRGARPGMRPRPPAGAPAAGGAAGARPRMRRPGGMHAEPQPAVFCKRPPFPP
jgi:hypothetical protein